jgi:hypothetical protein
MEIGDVATLTATGVAVVAAFFAFSQARASKEQAAAALDQLKEAHAQSKLAQEQLTLAQQSAEQRRRETEAFAGSQTAIAWRDQVLRLHDRGLTSGEIRFMMHLEEGGLAYEEWNGPIEELLRNVSALTSMSARPAQSDQFCGPVDPGHDCAGSCRTVLEHRGYSAYRRVHGQANWKVS